MEVSKDNLNGWRTGPMYSIGTAARLAGVHPITVRRWLYGDESPERRMHPVFGKRERVEEEKVAVSFLQLVEIRVVSRFRSKKVTLERLRRAHKFARERFGIEYPFARFSLKTDGIHVLRQFEESEPGSSLLALDLEGQLTLPGDVLQTLETFEFEQDLAARWFPAGKDVPIVVDPRFGAGMPTISKRRLAIDTIYKRWAAGQSIQFIAEDFRLQSSVVEAALRFAKGYAA